MLGHLHPNRLDGPGKGEACAQGIRPQKKPVPDGYSTAKMGSKRMPTMLFHSTEQPFVENQPE